MRFTPRTWSLLSILLFIAAAFFWLKGNEVEEQRRKSDPTRKLAATNKTLGHMELMSARALAGTPMQQLGLAPATSPIPAATTEELHPYMLRNTSRTMADLGRDDHAVLLANALIDTTTGEKLQIPDHLRAAGDPGSYIVQARTSIDGQFRKTLVAQGAEIISYVPNNAYFVRVNKEGADALAANASVQSVIAFEPYYKVAEPLLPSAVEQVDLEPGSLLRVTTIPGRNDEALEGLKNLGAEILLQEKSPFGPQFVVRPPANGLVSIAQMASIQAIEPDLARVPASDLTRITLAIATNSTASNYLNLSGSNIWVNFNDTAVDTNHPALAGKIHVGHPSMASDDVEGHGTFVAGLIVGSGENSPTGTNVWGSSNAFFRGIAPAATLLGLPLQNGEEVYPKVMDTYLIETAASSNYLTFQKTNALISNNSWTYNVATYDSSAARFDAAVRDALPGASGEQPLLFVFAAGNSGFGSDDGRGGQSGAIGSPGTAKNVITVGALESLRMIELGYTNETYVTNVVNGVEEILTNTTAVFPFIDASDSSNQVASYSSRGNVGIGIEGDFGRFKPDVVAPGSLLVSLRSKGWNITNVVDTNSNFGKLYSQLHTNIDEYRYDSGTTFSAANVSGMLALIQEYFETQAPTPLRRSLSPAMMKALLVNGSRSIAEFYHLAVYSAPNYQGWGLPQLPNIFPSYSTNAHTSLDEKKWRLRMIDQDPTNALATGQSRTWRVKLSTNASVFPLRATLVWTDPPGNPLVGVKLVNDLDLIVTNIESGVVWYGNNMRSGTDFTEPTTTNDFPVIDFVNNVENVFINNPKQLGREFTITVQARRVNVDAVHNDLALTGNTTSDVTQDFALVISSEIGADPTLNDEDFYYPEDSEVFEEFTAPTKVDLMDRPALTVITNGLPLLTERVGANPSLGAFNSRTNQWNFYVFTNVYISNSLVNITNGSNIAFITFTAPNLSVPRNVDGDIDLYVSRDPNLTNLNAGAIAAALKSQERGGEESVIMTNANIGDIFYVGVKSEDQQGAEYSLIGVSTDGAFERDENGRKVLTGVPGGSVLQDGSANKPNAVPVFAIGISNTRVRRAVVQTTLTHENIGDLVGILRHKGENATLNNHTLNGGTNRVVNAVFRYDDAGYEPGSRPSDGPGTLDNFLGMKLQGPWELQMIDNAPSHTGRVELLEIYIDPLQPGLLNGIPIVGRIDTTNILYYPIDLPAGVENINLRFSDITPPGATIRASIAFDRLPTATDFDFQDTVSAPGGTLIFPGSTNGTPLFPGTYYLALENVNPSLIVDFTLLMTFDYAVNKGNNLNVTVPGNSILDDATTNKVIEVLDDKLVTSARVSVRMDHMRVSDTVLHLVSPQGTRVMLAENRGRTNQEGFGATYVTQVSSNTFLTNTAYTVFTEDTNLTTVPIKLATPPFTGAAGTNGLGLVFTNSFEGATNGNYLAGTTVAGWRVFGTNTTNAASQPTPAMVSILTGPQFSTSGTNGLSLGSANIETNLATVPGQAYKMTFAYRGAPPLTMFSTGVDDQRELLDGPELDPHYTLVQSTVTNWPGMEAFVLPTFDPAPPVAGWAGFSAGSRWIAPYPAVSTTNEPITGTSIYRTYVDLYDHDTRTALVRFRFGGANSATNVYLNGAALNLSGSTAPNFLTSPVFAVSGFTYGLNILDFHVPTTRANTGFRLETTEFVQGNKPAASARLVVNDSTNSFAGGGDWTTFTYEFIATNTTTTVQFLSQVGEVWLDSISIEGTGNRFVLPEEPLELVVGERALGYWSLEMTDSRTGAALPIPEMLEWKLDLTYANPIVNTEILSPGATYPTVATNTPQTRIIPGEIRTNQVQYFTVRTCPDTTRATITLVGLTNVPGSLELLVDRSGLPTGSPDMDDYVPVRNFNNAGGLPTATFVLTTTSPASAPLIPGNRLFLAVRGYFIDQTNTYTLRVDLDRASCNTRQSTRITPTSQINSTLAAASASASNEPEETEGELFEVLVPTGAQSFTIETKSVGDLAILAKLGSQPSRNDYDFIQNVAGSGNETLVVSNPNGALTPGRWYVLVVNNSPTAVSYSVTGSGNIAGENGFLELSATTSAGGITLHWDGEAGRAYQVLSSVNLVDWTPEEVITSQGGTTVFTDDQAAAYKFYRVIAQ